MLLKLENLSCHYGTVQALSDVNLHVDEGEIVTLIGANGAGKTDPPEGNLRTGPTSQGQVIFADQRIDQLPPDEIVRRGLPMSRRDGWSSPPSPCGKTS